jgi:uncharacterized membrane protein YfcA
VSTAPPSPDASRCSVPNDVVADLLVVLAIGLFAGVLSGMFGVGGGVLTTPAIRLVVGVPALIAVGTPLPVIIPTAITGALAYARRGMADVRAGLAIGAWGAVSAVAGALASEAVGGTTVMVLTAALIGYMAFDMIVSVVRGDATQRAPFHERHPRRGTALAVLGIITGAYSGLLGLGGGFVLVPMLGRVFGFPIKRAIGTSLVAIGVLALPGSLAHWALGHVDLRLAAGLAAGVIPGALLGARLTAVANERLVRIGFSVLLIVAGAALALNELGWTPW